MAAPSTTTRPASRTYRRQALIWLLMTLLLGVATALVWMVSQTPAVGARIENAPISAPQDLPTELEQPLSIEALNELDTDVQPINFEDTVRDLRNYPDEFKDKRYLLANKGKWTVQVMNVGENEVIVSYLEGREDRKKFAYFRYRDEDNQLRYMLTYGLLSSPQEAVGAAKLIDFSLPANVRVFAEDINRYVSIIDNYERPEPIKDLSTKRSRSVKLQPTKREVPVRQKAPVATEDSSSNSSAATSGESNGGSNAAASNESSSAESIRQSADTSATLSVNEERSVATENNKEATQSAKNDDKSRKAESESKKPASTDNTSKKPPVVPAPKPPSNTNSANSDTNNSNKNANTGANKGNNDSIKELIEEKTN